MIQIVQRQSEGATAPQQDHEDARIFSIFPLKDERIENDTLTKIQTGLEVRIPPGFYARIMPSPGLGYSVVLQHLHATPKTMPLEIEVIQRTGHYTNLSRNTCIAHLIVDRLDERPCLEVSYA